MTSPATVGWCPGALRPMESGDGLLVRVKPSGGRLTFDQAETLARLALRDGNGQIDLTSRANLQIRGVTAAALARMTDDLHAVGLLDRSAAAEAVRNIVVSPLAGLDPGAANVRPLVRALEARLADDALLHGLPAKWSFVVDDGGTLPLSDVGADVRLLCGPGELVRLQLDGVDAAAQIAAADVPEVVSRIGALAGRDGAGERMRDLAAALGRRILDDLGLTPVPRLRDGRPRPTSTDLLGDQGLFLGFAPAFGSLVASDLLVAVDALRAAGGCELRLTPWRVLLAPHLKAQAVADVLRAAGFVLDGGDPRLTVSACVGAPACRRATTPTRAHAGQLTARAKGAIHIAGCTKGCGQTAAARWTLVGRDGAYDVVAQGTARDAAVAQRLSFPEAAAWISRADHARTV